MIENTDILLYYGRTERKNSLAARAGGLSVMAFGDGRPNLALCLLHFPDMLQQDIFDIVRHGAVLCGGKRPDFVKDLILQSETLKLLEKK